MSHKENSHMMLTNKRESVGEYQAKESDTSIFQDYHLENPKTDIHRFPKSQKKKKINQCSIFFYKLFQKRDQFSAALTHLDHITFI